MTKYGHLDKTTVTKVEVKVVCAVKIDLFDILRALLRARLVCAKRHQARASACTRTENQTFAWRSGLNSSGKTASTPDPHDYNVVGHTRPTLRSQATL